MAVASEGRVMMEAHELWRAGEGPGEIQHPVDLFQMSDGVLGVAEGLPAKVVRFSSEGVPLPSILVGEEKNTGLGNLMEGKYRGDNLVLCGRSMEQHQDGFQVTEYLAGFSDDGIEEVGYLEISYVNNVAEPEFHEKKRHFVNNGRWTVGPDGSVYAAPVFNEYEIHVFDPQGGFRNQVSLKMEGNPRQDRLFWIGDNFLAVVHVDNGDETSEQGAPLELIYYQVKQGGIR